jgi:O-acetyl-ADP-ribose deacetylase (regulator of RNase III)
MLTLDDYHSEIELGAPFIADPPISAHDYPALITELLELFGAEAAQPVPLTASDAERRRLLKALLTVRPPHPLDDAVWRKLDRLFHFEKLDRGRVDPNELPMLAAEYDSCRYAFANRTVLWQGDISLLAADAITNAANNALLGCFQPFHNCIDNAIHSCAGPRLRDDCEKIMRLQGQPEDTRHAKLTRAYHLPSRYVAHTVGPIVGSGQPSPRQAAELANCYTNTLDTCAQLGDIRSVAFCCISTGVFGYPQEKAAGVAIRAVEQWRLDHPRSTIDTVIFNVFRDDDREIYMRLFEEY